VAINCPIDADFSKLIAQPRRLAMNRRRAVSRISSLPFCAFNYASGLVDYP
jgi:hypothetical protein